jgi:hypothetical protein
MNFLAGLRTSAGRDGWLQLLVPHQFTSTLAAGSDDFRESELGVVHRRFDAMTTWPPACALDIAAHGFVWIIRRRCRTADVGVSRATLNRYSLIESGGQTPVARARR